MRIFPVAHCGALGTINRNKNPYSEAELKKHGLDINDNLASQKLDWEKAAVLIR